MLNCGVSRSDLGSCTVSFLDKVRDSDNAIALEAVDRIMLSNDGLSRGLILLELLLNVVLLDRLKNPVSPAAVVDQNRVLDRSEGLNDLG
jgi:hypothetical protein